MPQELPTPRLRLVPVSAPMADAAVNDLRRLKHLLNADVPDSWPPRDLADVQGLMADRLREDPTKAGWWGWYMIARPTIVGERATLIGSLGCTRWGAEQRVQFGYGILPEFERRGLTSEAAETLIGWVFTQPGVDLVEATTFERHLASIRILERCGFECRGVSEQDATASEADRQGRGKLLVFERTSRGPGKH